MILTIERPSYEQPLATLKLKSSLELTHPEARCSVTAGTGEWACTAVASLEDYAPCLLSLPACDFVVHKSRAARLQADEGEGSHLLQSI
jgi:hypothetical protein